MVTEERRRGEGEFFAGGMGEEGVVHAAIDK